MSELLFEGPVALAGSVRGGEVSPRELVELSLRRIEALDPRLNAFRVVMAESALAEAAGVATDGPLAGVPIAVKDNFVVAGQAMTLGSRSYGPPAESDGEVVRRLRAAGAIPVGITNVPELMIFPWTASAANGVTRNPWDLTRTPGGSSGGSAAAVAAGMVPCGTATDGGGSIRIPAACCGLVGMKPSRGGAPGRRGSADWLGLSVNGARARTVRDRALLLDVVSSSQAFVEAASRPPGRLRIAVSRKAPPGLIVKLSDDQRGAWERTRDRLAELGHEVIERDPAYGLVGVEFLQTWFRGIYEESLDVPDRSLLERSTREMASLGRRVVPDRRRERLLARRERVSERILDLWDEVDVLLTPGLARTALDAEGAFGRPAVIAVDRASRFTPFSTPFNYTGQPACTIPAGFGSDGLPLSVQLVGRRGGEEVLYSLAGQLEAAWPWDEYRPPIATTGGPPE